ncbi:MAG: TetR family transcriptional regulator [Acidimicrobiales bacterium]
MGPRAIATMEAIEVVALGEFSKRGFQETTAEHIAAASGVSVRTFFRYFPRGKQDVMVLGFGRWVRQLEEAVRVRPPQESAWTALREAVRGIPALGPNEAVSTEAIWMHRELARRHPGLHERMTADYHALAEPLVEMVSLRLSVDPGVDLRPRLMVHTMIATAMVTWLAWLADAELDGFATFEQALDVLEEGMARAAVPVPVPVLAVTLS